MKIKDIELKHLCEEAQIVARHDVQHAWVAYDPEMCSVVVRVHSDKYGVPEILLSVATGRGLRAKALIKQLEYRLAKHACEIREYWREINPSVFQWAMDANSAGR